MKTNKSKYQMQILYINLKCHIKCKTIAPPQTMQKNHLWCRSKISYAERSQTAATPMPDTGSLDNTGGKIEVKD